MPLTHVCLWDPTTGYRRITAEEACRLFPHGVAAKSGHFVCELCTQNVLLTAPGIKAQHFRHDPASPNKECDERQVSFDPDYGRRLQSLSSHIMPLRIVVKDSGFILQLGFFFPPDERANCSRIRITGDSRQAYEYSFERIERIGTTYLNVGSAPSEVYSIEYKGANDALKRYWPTEVPGVNLGGSFFDGQTGEMIQTGGKAYFGHFYYLLHRRPLYDLPTDIQAEEMAKTQEKSFFNWYLYRIHIKKFSEEAANFFLKYAVFLTEKPAKFYPVWPVYIRDPYFIYYDAAEIYLYLQGGDTELKSYPETANMQDAGDGKLYRLLTRGKEQLVSLGKSGALAFSYLVRRPLNRKASLPEVTVSDIEGNPLNEEKYARLPPARCITVSGAYDGKAAVHRKGRTEYICKITGGEPLVIDELSFGTEVELFQGCDRIRSIRFERESADMDALARDSRLVRRLDACPGPVVPVTHAVGSLIARLEKYPRTKEWLTAAVRRGEISRSALRLLEKTIHNDCWRDYDV